MNRTILLFALLSIIFVSCTNSNHKVGTEHDEEETWIQQSDSIVYSYYPATVAPKYYRGYTITVTDQKLGLAVNSYSDTLLQKEWPFTEERFEEVKEKLKDLEQEGSIDESDIGEGGTSKKLSVYQQNKLLISARDFGGSNKDYEGADINITYLIPDLQEIIASTKED